MSAKRVFGFDLLREQVLEHIEAEFDCCLSDAKGDSEIERLLFFALQMKVRFGETEYRVFHDCETDKDYAWFCDNCADPLGWLLLRRQVQLENRRVDFIISVFDITSGRCGRDPMDFLRGSDRKWQSLIIECDGHDYHERTKEQAARDRSRDRRAVLSGIPCFRFTGSEIWRDPYGCAEEVIDWARNITFPRED